MRWLLCLLPAFLLMPPLRADDASMSREIGLPGEVDGVIRAGRGDKLLLPMSKLGKLAVFDLTTEKLDVTIPLGENALVVGTADNIILIDRDKKLLHRWSLNPLERKRTVALTIEEQVDAAVGGYAANRPILIMSRQKPHFLDTEKLKIVEVTPNEISHVWHPHPQYPFSIAASADGTTFTGWVNGLSPQGIRVMKLDGKRVSSQDQHDTAGALLPNADGSLLFTSSGILNADLTTNTRNRQVSRTQMFPSLHPAYYLGVTTENTNRTFALYSSGDRTLLLPFDKLPGLTRVDVARPGKRPRGEAVRQDRAIPIYDQIIAHPAEKKLIVLDDNHSLLHILPLDLVKALNAKGIDYLFVDSMPVVTAVRGEKYEYAVKVMSKAGKVKYKLDTGPDGMTISADGVLKWSVPKDYDATKSGVIVSIEDGSTQSLFHTFTIGTMDAVKGEK